jgi:hypothetical protein
MFAFFRVEVSTRIRSWLIVVMRWPAISSVRVGNSTVRGSSTLSVDEAVDRGFGRRLSRTKADLYAHSITQSVSKEIPRLRFGSVPRRLGKLELGAAYAQFLAV